MVKKVQVQPNPQQTQQIINSKFHNKLYNVLLIDTNKCKDSGEELVVKNAPFLIIISPQKGTKSELPTSLANAEEQVKVSLVYDNNIENQVTYLSTKPFDYNIYHKDTSLTVETRLQVLSSKHENNQFRVVVEFNSHKVITEPVKCVSKLDTKKKRPTTTTTTTSTKNNNNSVRSSSPITVPDSPINNNQDNQITPTKNNNKRSRDDEEEQQEEINNNNNSSERDLKRLKRQQRKDRELISLLYKQNIMLIGQVNSLTTGLNKLINIHNDKLYNNNSQQQIEGNYNNNNNQFNQHHQQQQYSIAYSPMSPSSSIPSSPVEVPVTILSSQENNNNSEFPSIDPEAWDTNQVDFPSYTSQLANDMMFDNHQHQKCHQAMQLQQTQQPIVSVDCQQNTNDYQVIDRLSSSSSNYQLSLNNSYSHSLLDLNLDFSRFDSLSSPLSSSNSSIVTVSSTMAPGVQSTQDDIVEPMDTLVEVVPLVFNSNYLIGANN